MMKKSDFEIYMDELKSKKGTFMVFVILRMLVFFVLIRSFMVGSYENLFYCVLTLILFTVPSALEKRLGIELPSALEVVILLFIFGAEILGEMGSYYTKYPYWDSILHTINGFLCAAIGFALIDILNRNEKIKFKLSPLFLAIVAFCFSMTIGVLWEFFEFFMDACFMTDMQKDTAIGHIVSTYLGNNTKEPFVIENIKETAVNGTLLKINGYLDIGLYDTMKDLFVNFIGALFFSVIGFFYVKTRGKGRLAKMFIPKIKNPRNEDKEDEKA